MWTDLYKPRSIFELVGNEGSINQLYEWLRDWDDVQVYGNKKEIPGGFFMYMRNPQDMPKPNAKAAMVSGPPGIGKTSAVKIICKTLGFEVLEMDAST